MNTMADTTLVLRRTFAATRARVWRAWTEELGEWYALNDSWEVVYAEADPRPGGTFRIGWRVGDREFGEHGTYLEVREGELLVYTVTLAGVDEADVEGTVCRVEFNEHPDGCEVVITESGYPSVESRDLHASGWPSFLDRLVRMLGEQGG